MPIENRCLFFLGYVSEPVFYLSPKAFSDVGSYFKLNNLDRWTVEGIENFFQGTEFNPNGIKVENGVHFFFKSRFKNNPAHNIFGSMFGPWTKHVISKIIKNLKRVHKTRSVTSLALLYVNIHLSHQQCGI